MLHERLVRLAVCRAADEVFDFERPEKAFVARVFELDGLRPEAVAENVRYGEAELAETLRFGVEGLAIVRVIIVDVNVDLFVFCNDFTL